MSGLADNKLSEPEIHGVCKTLLQADPNSTVSSIYVAVSWLSTPAGRDFQSELYSCILSVYDGDRDAAWNNSFCKEIGTASLDVQRSVAVLGDSSVCAAKNDGYEYQVRVGGEETAIQKGITMIMNAQQANHDRA